MSKPHLFIATPMFGGMCTGFYTQSIVTMQKVMGQEGISCTFSFMFNESLIQRARNGLVDQFLKTDATHLFFIDADIKFIAEQILHMLAVDKDIICGIYPKKEINWKGVKEGVDTGVPVDKLKACTGSLVVNLVDYQGSVTVPAFEPIEIWAGGTGFMLIKREVFEKLADKVPAYTNNVGTVNVDYYESEDYAQFENALVNAPKPNLIKEYFATSIDPATNVLLSEDYHFCHVARANGIKVYAAPWVQLAHLGSYLFEGGLVPQEGK
jgi:hypothetical protein